MHEPDQNSEGRVRIDARDARGGEVILRRRRNRTIFIAGLVAFAVLAIALRLFG
jgi:hypothetical protein